MGDVGGYCERVGPGLWAEPLNAVSNLAFLAAAVALWVVSRGAPPRLRPLPNRRPSTVEIQLLALNDFHGNLEPPSGSSGVPAGGVE